MARALALWGAAAVSLGLSGGTGCGGRKKPSATSASGLEGPFRDEAADRGIRFSVGHGGKTPLNIRETLGTGVALWDYDGDGWLDAFLVGQEGATPRGIGALFRGRGDGTFEERTAGSGLDVPGPWHGCAVGDVDNDGRPDLLLTGMGQCRLFRNLGEGRFRDSTEPSGLKARSRLDWNTSAAFADVNRDGRLDLFVGRYVRFGPEDLQFCDHFGVKAACGPRSYDPQIGSLYLQDAQGRFRDVTAEMGLQDQHGKTLGVAFADVNEDGFPDLYLANDEVPGDLYLNANGKRFRNVGATSGTALSGEAREQGGMGADWSDYDGDGRQDLFVTTFQTEPNSLYRNLGDASFEEQGELVGISQITRPFVAFGTRFLDFNCDGFPDLVSVNGHMKDNIAQIDTTTTYRQRSQLLRNEGGRRFVEIRGETGQALEQPIVGRGLAVGDVDRDGDPDVLVSDLEGPARLWVNRGQPAANWLSLRLTGSSSNRMALGAVVRVKAGDREWVRQCQTGGSFLSASSADVHFGLGSQTEVDLEVHWPSGRVTRRSKVRVNQRLTVAEGAR